MLTWPETHVLASQAITGYLYYLYAVLPASIPQEKEDEKGKKIWTHLKVAVLTGLKV